MPTKAELQAENDEPRSTLEHARDIIDEALGIETDDASEHESEEEIE